MAFKIKDGLRVGDTDVLNVDGQLLSPKIKDSTSANSVTVQTAQLTSNRTLEIPNIDGTLITTGDSGSVTSAMIADGAIVNGDINANAAIVDTKLATIDTADKVALSAVDIDGAADIGQALSDNDLLAVDLGAAGANRKSFVSRLPTYVFTKVSGDITIGSSGVANIEPNAVTLGTDTTGNYVATVSGTTNQVSVSGSETESAEITLSLPQNIHTAATPSFAGMILTGELSMSTANKIINLATPTNASDAATKEYVDEVAQGLTARTSADILVDDNLIADYLNGTAGVGATLTSTTNGVFPEIDGVTLSVVGSRILVTAQTNSAHNGLYTLDVVGDTNTAFVLLRDPESNESSKIPGSFVFVQQGTVYANTGWVAIVNDPDSFVIGTDEIQWNQFSGAGSFLAGTGLTLTGNLFSVNENLSHVSGLGTITSGTWQGSIINPTYGGTGVDNGSNTITLGGSLTTSGAHTLTVTTTDSTSVTLPTTGTLAVIGSGLNQFAATTSAELAGVISDKTGSGQLVFNTNPTITTGITAGSGSFDLINTTATTVNAFGTATAVNIGAATGTTTVNNNLTVSGDLTVSGTTTTLNSATLQVEDKNIELGKVAVPTNTTANGGGITILAGTDVDKTFSWLNASDSWTSSEHLDIASGKDYKINSVSVLSSTALGSSVVSSSLTSVGTITSGTWQGSIINPTYGGTGVDNGSNTITLGGSLTTSGAHTLTLNTSTNTNVTLPASGTLATTGKLTQFAATTSAELAGVISDETGSGLLVFNTNPSFVTSVTTTSETFAVFNTTATTVNAFGTATTVNIGAATGTTTVNNDFVVNGDLTVNGSTTTLNTATLQVEDKNIELAKVDTPTDTTADGAGITIKGAVDKTFNWVNASNSWTASENMDLASGKEYKVNATTVLSASALGTGVIDSSLTSVGTITTGVWQATAISVAHGGTGATTAGDARTNLGATTVGSNLFTLPNPSAVRFLRLNTDNTVSALTASDFRAALGGGSEATTAVSSISATVVDSFPISEFRSAKYVVQITQGTSFQVSEILVIHDGTTTYTTEYAVLETSGELATFTSDVSSGNVRLLVTMGSASAATVKLDRATITI